MKRFKVYASRNALLEISQSDMEILDELCDSIVYQENKYCEGEGYKLSDLYQTVLTHVDDAFDEMPEEYPESLVQHYLANSSKFKNAVKQCVRNHYGDYIWRW